MASIAENAATSAGYLAGALALLAAGTVATRLHAGDHHRLLRPYVVAGLASLGLAVAITTPDALRATASWDVLVPNEMRLVGNILAMVAACCVLAVMTHTLVPHPRQARRIIAGHVGVLVGSVAAMVTLLVAAHTTTTVQFAATYAHNLAAVAYEVIDVLYVLAAGIGLSWLINRYVAVPAMRITGLILRLNRAATVGVVGWAVWKLVNIGLAVGGVSTLSADQNVVSELLAAVLVGSASVGCALPVWTRWVTTGLHRGRVWRYYHRLDPLWTVLTGLVPEVMLPGAEEHGLEFALFRRAVEIRDAQNELRQHIDPQVRERCLQAALRDDVRSGDAMELLVEAAELAAAISGRHHGLSHPPDSTSASVRSAAPSSVSASDTGAPSVLREAKWLARLSRTLFSSPAFAEARASWANGPPSRAACR